MRREQRTRRRSKKESEVVAQPASDILNIEVTLIPPSEGLSVVKSAERPSLINMERFYADHSRVDQTATALTRLGFQVTAVSRISISVKAPRELFTRTFGTQLNTFRQPLRVAQRNVVQEFYYPREGASWDAPEPLTGLIDDAYIQWPHIYFELPIPPRVQYHHLRVPGDISLVLNADKVHREGTTGEGVKVVMVDSGYYTSHSYFQKRGYNMSVMLAPGATDATKDGNGHGTAECANIFAIAPDIHFIGVKVDNEQDPQLGASLAEGFKTAVAQNPDIITVSMGYDLVYPNTRKHLPSLPNSLKPLEAEVKAAVTSGIIVIFSAGNGHVSFPGMMPEVISAGGTYVDEKMERQASDYASAFTSRIYPGRHVPDVTGLVGLMKTDGAYIMLPVQRSCEIDREVASDRDRLGNPQFPDGTNPNDGWAVISGTSASAPQIAGVCAILKQKNPGLKPLEVKNVLKRTAKDVIKGRANPASNEGKAIKANPGPDGATGHGLVDVFAAWKQV